MIEGLGVWLEKAGLEFVVGDFASLTAYERLSR